MIPRKDLRVGNLVMTETGPWEVTDPEVGSEADGIPLQEVFLDFSNAIRIKEGQFSLPVNDRLFIFNYDKVREKWWIVLKDKSDGQETIFPTFLRYVHELQNFYYFVTQKELVFKAKN